MLLDQFPFREDPVEAARSSIRTIRALDSAARPHSISSALSAAQDRQDALAAQRIVMTCLLGTVADRQRQPKVMDTKARSSELRKLATSIRRRDMQMVITAGSGHIGGDISATDILVDALFRGAASGPAAARRSRPRPLYSEQRALRRRRCTPRWPTRLLPDRRARDVLPSRSRS